MVQRSSPFCECFDNSRFSFVLFIQQHPTYDAILCACGTQVHCTYSVRHTHVVHVTYYNLVLAVKNVVFVESL